MGKGFPFDRNADAFEHPRHQLFGDLERIGNQTGNLARRGMEKTVGIVCRIDDDVIVETVRTVAAVFRFDKIHQILSGMIVDYLLQTEEIFQDPFVQPVFGRIFRTALP